MSSVKEASGGSNTTIPITLASLGIAAVQASAVVDNSSNLYLDALVQLKVKAGASGTSATGYLNVYAYATADGGTTYGDTATGSDASVTLTVPPNLRLIGVINVVANATTYKSNPMGVAAAFGGILPAKWGIAVENQSGHALDATAGNFAAFFEPFYATVV